MSNKEKFEVFKQKLINENESKYGSEIREKYGEAAVDQSNIKIKGMTEEQMEEAENLSNAIAVSLKDAIQQGDPMGELAQKACDLHRRWLCFFWPEGQYSKEAHMNIGNMYCNDARFKAYYDNIMQGCAEFLRDALEVYCK